MFLLPWFVSNVNKTWKRWIDCLENKYSSMFPCVLFNIILYFLLLRFFFPSFFSTMSSIIFFLLWSASYYKPLWFVVLFGFHRFLSNSHVFYVPVHSAIAVNCGTRFKIAIAWHQFIINATTRSTLKPSYSLLLSLYYYYRLQTIVDQTKRSTTSLVQLLR